MGHTNSTANLALPQFIGTDKPTWLGDINGAFLAIDGYVGTNDAAVSGAVSDAASAISQAASAVSTANAANTTAGNASTAATNAVGTANNAMSLVNQTNTKIGTLANLTTTDKTSIVNAINEVNGLCGTESESVTADGIKTYADLLAELFALLDMTKARPQSQVIWIENGTSHCYNINTLKSDLITVSSIWVLSGGLTADAIVLRSASCEFKTKTEGATATNKSANVATSGEVIEFIY